MFKVKNGFVLPFGQSAKVDFVLPSEQPEIDLDLALVLDLKHP